MVRSGRSTSGMSWLNAIAAASPMAPATGSDGPVPRRQRLGGLHEAERPGGDQQHRQRRLQPERQQRDARQRGQHRQQRPQVDGQHADGQGARPHRRAGPHHQPQRAQHADRAQQRELQHREGQFGAVGRQVVIGAAGVADRAARRPQRNGSQVVAAMAAAMSGDDGQPAQWIQRGLADRPAASVRRPAAGAISAIVNALKPNSSVYQVAVEAEEYPGADHRGPTAPCPAARRRADPTTSAPAPAAAAR